MRWIPFCILLYVATALQTAHVLGLAPDKDYPAIEYLPLLAIFYAMFASEDAAPLCGFWCGLALDLISPGQPLGTAAVPLALVAFIAVRIRLSIFREHVVSQLIVTLLGILLFALMSAILRAVLGAPEPTRLATFWHVFYPLSINAAFSAAVAPFLFWMILRLKPVLGFEPTRGRKR